MVALLSNAREPRFHRFYDFTDCTMATAQALRDELIAASKRGQVSFGLHHLDSLQGARYFGRVVCSHREYHVLVFRHPSSKGGIRICVGCRWYTVEQAERHWRRGGWGVEGRRRAKQMLALLSVIKIMATQEWGCKFRSLKVAY